MLRNGCGARRGGSGFGRVGFGCGYSGYRLRRSIAGHVLCPSCHTFFVPPSYGSACNLFEVHRLCVFGVFLFANIRHEKAFVKPFTVTLLITRRFIFVNRESACRFSFSGEIPVKDVKAESSP